MESALPALWSLHDHLIPHHRNNYRPHVLGHRVLVLFSILLLSVKISTIAFLGLSATVETAYSSAITTDTIFNLTNQSRQDSKLASLSLNSQLSRAAQNKANDMAAKGYFSHETPDGKTPWDFIKAVGYSYLSAGENLAVDFTQAENVETAWMNSPGHRANILNQDFKEIGIGIASGNFQGHDSIFVVQMFGQPVASKITLQDKPTVVAASPAGSTVPAPKPSTASSNPLKQPASQPTVSSPTPARATPVPAPAANPEPEANPLAINDISTIQEGDGLKVSVIVPPTAVKVFAQYGGKAIMLQPKSNDTWEGLVPAVDLKGQSLQVSVADMFGHTAWKAVGSFVTTWQDSYRLAGQVQGETVKIFGLSLQPKVVEQKFYLLFIAAMLGCLVLAIGIRRHVQHLGMIANTSFVVVLACLLLLTG